MSDANAISDLERAEHLGYADGKGVKRVSIFNDGVQINAATEEKQDSIITAIRPLSGAGANGTVALTSANTWYAVPSTVPTSDYVLVATIENGLGTVRFGFSNSGTPSTTNGNPAPGELTVKLAANQSIYYASSTAGDDINWTTKIL